jgi:TRAP-type C4-dicarboxylate transport system permease small subunit
MNLDDAGRGSREAPRLLRRADRVLGMIAALTLTAMVLLTCVDVVGRYFFNQPLTGAFELTEHAMGALVFSSLPLVALRRQHVTVDLFDRLVPMRWKRLQGAIVDLVAAVCTGAIAWRLLVKALEMRENGETTAVLQFVVHPLVFFMATLTFIAVIVMLVLAWLDATGKRPVTVE